MRFVIISGVSGAGKSQVVKYLEDLGFFCVDNMPPSLLPKFAELCFKSSDKMDKVALVIDIRGKEFFKDIFAEMDALKDAKFPYEVLFLDASDKVLIKRYKETRRSHPLAPEGRIMRGINEERKILEGIRNRADYIIDTSNLSTKQLRSEIINIFVDGRKFEGLIVNIISFGFKYGTPIDCDLVFDVRFIPNPYYIDSMRKLTGKHETVSKYVLESPETVEFMGMLNQMLEFLIPNYIKEGKNQLVIGIGCTGGKHRSVAIADELYNSLGSMHHRVVIEHRDIDKDNRGAVR